MSDVDRDAKKDTVEAVATGFAIAAAGLDPSMAGAVAGVSLVALAKMVFNKFTKRSEDRVLRLIRYILEGDDSADDLATRVLVEVIEDRGTAEQAVLEGARAATEAVEDGALPHIAGASRAYARGRIDLWTFRRLLSALRELTEVQIRQMLALLQVVGEAPREKVIVQYSELFDAGEVGNLSIIIDDRGERGPSGPAWAAFRTVGPTPGAGVLLDVMRRAGVGDSTGFGASGGGLGFWASRARAMAAAITVDPQRAKGDRA